MSGGDRLLPGQNLVRGTRLYSADNAYFLASRSRDGWLCLYEAASGRVVWTNRRSSFWTTLYPSGALASFDSYGRKVWQNTVPAGQASMMVTNKGYLAVRRTSDAKVVWTSPH